MPFASDGPDGPGAGTAGHRGLVAMTDRETSPGAEYGRRETSRVDRAAESARREEMISRARLGVVIAAALIAWQAFGAGRLSAWWLLAPAAAFVSLLAVHARARRHRLRAERGAAYYRRGLARLDGRWAGTGRTGVRFRDPHHPYAEDLDLFGDGSLFELLCEARTSMGEERLAAWLLAPSDVAAVRGRQAAVQALTPRLDLREDLAVLGEEVAATVRPDTLAGLQMATAPAPSVRLRLAAAAVSAGTLAVVAAWAVGWAPLFLALGALAVQGLVDWRLRGHVRAADRAVAGHGPDLDLLVAVLERFEREPTGSPLLDQLHATLITDGLRPSRAVRRLRIWVDLLDSRRNQFFSPFALATMWGVHCALAVEVWRARHGAAVGAWLSAVGQLEALCSLAGYAWEHPTDVYPTLEDGGARFEAEALGHPLIPEARCVRNDVALGGATRVLMVSGSNMSGKSTLLRAVGTSAVLAQAGAPVRAGRLHLSPLSLGATLRIRDSLQEGTSRFYAELVRLRDIVRIASGPVPLLFLLDEILHGTNSHDRRLGAAAVVRGLVQRGAIGLVTTHDLALSEVVDDPEVHAVNVHFEDRLDDGKMVFDYRMRPGVVRTSNALALMRTLGLWSDPAAG
jgi:MutS domain V